MRTLTDEEAKKVSEVFNGARVRYSKLGTEFSCRELTKTLQELGLPGSDNYITQYVKYGVIERKKAGVYIFPEEPVYYKKFQDSVGAVRKMISKANKVHYAKVRELKAPTEENLKQKELDAISFLKERGYRILKAEQRWFEC